jgi:uncharacterized SAM-binding protein YcdF (DUF218 family)
MFIFKLIGKLITFLLVLVLAIPTFAIARTWFDARNTKIESADAIVVMGAAQLDGRPGEVLEARLLEAKRIYENKYAKRLFTLGAGAPGDRFTEAGAAREWLGRNGIPRKSITAIRIGRDSYTSIEGLAKTVDEVKYKKIIIVTDPYHCLRSKTMAADFGFEASCSPVRSGIASVDRAGIRYLLREAGAYLAYVTLGRRGIHISDHIVSDHIEWEL